MKNLINLLSLAIFLAFPQTEIKAQQEKNYKNEIILNKEENNLALLKDYLNKKGFKIDSLLKDPKFKIYHGIASNFKKAPESTIKNLGEYKKIIRYEDKKEKISKFINENLEKLLEAEKTYGIKKEIIASVIGIESDFGEIIGKYNPFNAYVSLYVNGHKQEFAKIQLEELLIFCKKNKIDVLEMKSSYAGAISYAQFLPSSLNGWFVGEDLYNMNNNILSVANYLSFFKKKRGTLLNAIDSYNPSELYVQTVIDLAHDAGKELEKLEKNKK